MRLRGEACVGAGGKICHSQVDKKKARGGHNVGLFNPMRFLHSMETWKKEETEV